MQIDIGSFWPRWIPTLATVILFPLLLLLGFWQLERADQKEVLYKTYQQRSLLDLVDINQEQSYLSNRGDLLWRKARVTGQYVDDKILLLDNQINDGAAGYFVFSPIRIEQTAKRLLVNRGWVPADPYRNIVPDIDVSPGLVTVNGIFKDPPVTGVVFSDSIVEDMGNRVIRLQDIDIDELSKVLGMSLYPFVLRLESSSATGFIRDWPQPGSGKDRHIGYAFQWFAMAAILLIIFVITNNKRYKTNDPY